MAPAASILTLVCLLVGILLSIMHFCYYGWHLGQRHVEAAETFHPARKARETSLSPEVSEKANCSKGNDEGKLAPLPHLSPWALHLDNNSSRLQKPFLQVSAE